MIQPHEITIGSLLRTNTGEIVRVDCIGTKRQNRKVGFHREGDPCHIHYVRLNQCEGIPLTEEILKAFGFEDHKHDLTLDWSEGNVLDPEHVSNYITMVKWSIDNGRKVFRCGIIIHDTACFNREITCVHQLQSALYLCGLNDLADNFKIKQHQKKTD